ncbi:MAG: hypothetical protein NT070_02775, partial [Cyanobacteria bacterium]|nr:hypothetical protein [Cyanobacteriota bacterium]
FPCLVLPFLTTDTDWQDGQDGLDSDIDLLSNNHLDIFLHPFLFRTTRRRPFELVARFCDRSVLDEVSQIWLMRQIR